MTSYTPFLIMRALAGIGEASYATIAPTIISDMSVDRKRSTYLALYFLVLPVIICLFNSLCF